MRRGRIKHDREDKQMKMISTEGGEKIKTFLNNPKIMEKKSIKEKVKVRIGKSGLILLRSSKNKEKLNNQ